MQKKKLTRKERQKINPVEEIKPIAEVGSIFNPAKYSLLFFVFAIVLYSNTITHGWVYDDMSVITDNTLVQKGLDGVSEIFNSSYRFGWSGVEGNLYRPLTLSLFALEWELAPDNPTLGHILNILLYAISSFLLFQVLYHLLGRKRLFISLVATAIFVAHPIHTEVVANIKSADELLSLTFCLSSFYLILKWLEKKQIYSLIAGLFMFLLGMLSKESTVIFMLLIPIALYYFKDFSLKESVRLLGLFIVPLFLFLLIRKSALEGDMQAGQVALLDNVIISADGFLQQFMTAVSVLGIYLWKLFLPIKLVCDYSYPHIELSGFNDWRFYLSGLIYTSALVYAIKGIKDKNIISFSIFWILISLGLYSNILFVIGTIFGERFLFVPVIGFGLIIGVLIDKFLNKKPETLEEEDPRDVVIIKNNIAIVPVVIIVGLFGFQTVLRNADWKSNYDLFKKDVISHPNSARLHSQYGAELADLAKNEETLEFDSVLSQEALAQFKEGVRLYPEYSDGFFQLGYMYYRLGQMNEAITYYEESLRLKPTSAFAWNNLGAIYSNRKDGTNAIRCFQNAVKYNTNYFDAWLNLGITFIAVGENLKAQEAFKSALRVKPNDPKAMSLLRDATL